MKKIIEAIEAKYKEIKPFLALSTELSGTTFNTVLLELFKKRTEKIQPTDLVESFRQNRFVSPSGVDVLAYKALELEWLTLAEKHGDFIPIILSPLSPLGTCSVMGEVNQNNVVSAVRGTEVVSDITNVLALKIAADFRNHRLTDTVKYAATHRHVRGQAFDNPGFTAHFGVFCLVSGGFDTGSFNFEAEQLLEHINLHFLLLTHYFGKDNLSLKIYVRQQNPHFEALIQRKLLENEYRFELIEDYQKGDYYQMVQFKINLKQGSKDINLVDGGLVDWTQKLIPNKKHRLFISGCGIELVHKILEKQL